MHKAGATVKQAAFRPRLGLGPCFLPGFASSARISLTIDPPNNLLQYRPFQVLANHSPLNRASNMPQARQSTLGFVPYSRMNGNDSNPVQQVSRK